MTGIITRRTALSGEKTMLTICVSAVGDHWVIHRPGTDRVLCICGSRERAVNIAAAFAEREGGSLVVNDPYAQVS